MRARSHAYTNEAKGNEQATETHKSSLRDECSRGAARRNPFLIQLSCLPFLVVWFDVFIFRVLCAAGQALNNMLMHAHSAHVRVSRECLSCEMCLDGNKPNRTIIIIQRPSKVEHNGIDRFFSENGNWPRSMHPYIHIIFYGAFPFVVPCIRHGKPQCARLTCADAANMQALERSRISQCLLRSNVPK